MRNQHPIPNQLFRDSLKRIAEPIAFLDSAHEPMVQIADFVSGVIWAAAEGDEAFLLLYLRDYFPWGKRTYTFMYLT
jgi:hypothetical protein